jgi:hypothetical protein
VIIRIFYRVYNKRGLLCYGFLEKVYENAMMILVENKVIIEIISASSLVKKPEVKRKAFDNLRK